MFLQVPNEKKTGLEQSFRYTASRFSCKSKERCVFDKIQEYLC